MSTKPVRLNQWKTIALFLLSATCFVPPVSATDVDFGPYMANLQRVIKRNWLPPLGTEDRRVVVYFKVLKNGDVTLLRLDKSSGSLVSDDSALVAVAASAPARPLPSGAPDDVDIQFTFDYHKMNVGSSEKQESIIAETLKKSGDQRAKLASLYRGLGNIYGTSHLKTKAEEAYTKSIELYDQLHGRGSEDYVYVMGSKARYLYLHGPESDYAAATKVLDEAQKIVDEAKNTNASGDLDRIRAVLIFEPRSDYAQAEQSLKKAARKAKECKSLSDYQESQLGLADCLLQQQKVDETCAFLNARVMDAMADGQSGSEYVIGTARLLCYLYLHKKQDPAAAINLAESIYKQYKSENATNSKDPTTLQALDLCKTVAMDAKDETKKAEYAKLVEQSIAEGGTPRSSKSRESAGTKDPAGTENPISKGSWPPVERRK